MEASTLQPPASLTQSRIALGAPLLRLRSDEQLVALFRAGHDEAFRAIHDRYNKRLFAYARQMLPARQDAEDALQDVFVRAYAGLRASDRDLALRAWLFRVAHNRCIDELRKPSPPAPEVLQLLRTSPHDPLAEVDLRESMRRLVEDIRRLPEQQRSALLMRELAGMSYAELATSLGVSVGAVKSLLVRARLGLAQAAAARDTACAVIREQLVEAHDRGVRPNANTRKHVRDCSCCKSFRRDLRGVSRQLAATAPTVGPLGFLAKVLGVSGGGGAAGGGGGAALVGGGGTTASAGGLALGTGHVATLIVAAVATAGGAVAIQHAILPIARHAAQVRPHAPVRHHRPNVLATQSGAVAVQSPAEMPPPAVGRDPRVTLADIDSSGSTAPAHSPTTKGATGSATTTAVVGTGGTAVKRHGRSGATTTSTGTATTGSSTGAGCTAPGTSAPAGVTSPASSSSAANSSGSEPTSTPAAGVTSASTSPAPTASCGSTSGTPSGAPGPSTTNSTAGTSSASAGSTGTDTGSGSSTPPTSGSSAGSSQSGSNVATG